jgi:hypothetical protein
MDAFDDGAWAELRRNEYGDVSPPAVIFLQRLQSER